MQTAAEQAPRSFAALYRAEYGFARRTLRCLGVPERSLDDAAQDAFVVVHRRLPEFEGRASVRTWIYAIVRRIAWRYRTRAQRDDGRQVELPEVRAGLDLDAELDRETAKRILSAFVDGLDEDRATVFVLAELGELRGREIAASLDLNANTVSARLRSARIELDRLTHRLQARERRALLDSIRRDSDARPSQARSWIALSAKLGLGAPSTASTAAGSGWTVGWSLIGVAVVGVVISVAATTGNPEPIDVQTDPVARDSAAEAAVASPPQVVLPSAPSESPVPVAAPSPSPTDVQSPPPDPVVANAVAAPTLSEQVESLRAIRAAVGHDGDTLDRAVADFRLRFEDSPLRPEVEALVVEHACRRGHPDAAARLRAFTETSSNLGLRARLRRHCTETRESKFGPRNPIDPETP